MSEATKKNPLDEEAEGLVAVGPGVEAEEGETLTLEEEEQAGAKEAGEDDRRLASEAEDEERPRKKETSKERRARQKARLERERKELNFYRARNEALEKERAQYIQKLEGRVDQLSTAAIDQRIAKIEEQKALADSVSFQALKEGTREDYQKAQELRDRLATELVKLNHAKQEGTRQKTSAQSQPQAPTVDPLVAAYGQQWAGEHPWFDSGSGDVASLVVWALDESVQQDGFDPKTPEYWQELTRRCKKRLPEKFAANGSGGDDDDDDDDEEVAKPVKAAGPKFSAGGRERSLRKGEVYISADRKRALQEAGLWDDPKARQRMLKRYADMDAQHAASGA